jgi:hypothetical protein
MFYTALNSTASCFKDCLRQTVSAASHWSLCRETLHLFGRIVDFLWVLQ